MKTNPNLQEVKVKRGLLFPLALLLSTLLFANLASAGWDVTELTLDNGLTVLLQENHSAPLVSVWGWYKVGSKNERTGITGIAHWVEHMNFKGTKKFSKGDMWKLIHKAGGYENGYTWMDVTTYLETLPADKLDLALEMEAERMNNSIFDPEEVKSERWVVISELQIGENDPQEVLDIEVWASAFKAHPYHWPTIGWESDLKKITRDDLYNFYKSHYMPNNSVLVVVGDFKTNEVIPKIERLFGNIPSGKKPQALRTEEPKQKGERRVKVKGEGSTKYLQIGYKIPSVFHSDFYSLLVLDAILSGFKGVNTWPAHYWGQASKSSRLYKTFVDSRLATKVSGAPIPFADPSLYAFYLTLAEDADYQPAEQILYKEINRVINEEISPREFEKVKNQIKATFTYQSQSVTHQAHQIGYFETIGSWRYLESFLDSIESVTPEKVKEVAKKYLTEDGRTVGWYIPAGEKTEMLEESYALSRKMNFKSSVKGNISREKTNHKPKSKPKKRIFKNGLTVLVQENHSTPSVSIAVSTRAGSIFETDQKAGIANLTTHLLDQGTANHSKEEIAEFFDFLGAELSLSSSVQAANISAKSLSRHYKKVLGMINEMLLEPTFSKSEIDKLKAQTLDKLREERDDTYTMAHQKLLELIYPKAHPLHRPPRGDKRSLNNITGDDIISFHKGYYSPNNTIIAIVGDVKTEDVFDLMEKLFSGWRKGKKHKFKFGPYIKPSKKIEKKIVKIEGKSQADIAIGFWGPSRKNKDYYTFQLMNHILGQFGLGGRIGKNVREEQGLAYYARSRLTDSYGQPPFVAYAGVSPNNVDKAIETMLFEIGRITKKLVTDEELENSKDAMVGSIPRRVETNGDIAWHLITREFYNLGTNYFERYKKIIHSISKRDILRVAKKYLNPKAYKLVIAGSYEEK